MRAAILVVLAACFGEGPDPTAPSKATVLFALELHPLQVDGDCRNGAFIGNVALGADAGYVITHAFLPACGDGGNTGGSPSIPSVVYEFDKRTHAQEKIGDAGVVTHNGNTRPRVAARGDDAVWMYSEPQAEGVYQVRSKSGTINGSFVPMTQMGVPSPRSIIVDQDVTYVAITSLVNRPNMTSPRYPCCTGGPANTSGYSFVQLSNTSLASSVIGAPMFYSEQMKDALVSNSTALFVVEHAAPAARLTMQPKGGGATEMIAMLSAQPGGIAADDIHVAWSTTLDFTQTGSNDRSCSIFSSTVAAPRTETLLFSTTAFSCFDLALDGDHVYFTMVEHVDAEIDDLVRNIGIGRVQISTKQVETIALGIHGPQAAARQLFVDGDGIIVVAPFVIARIAKAELDGKRDIVP